MYIAYIDESGSTGSIATGGSTSYTLGCVLVRSSQWPQAFDALIGYRRFLKARFGLLMRSEVKANFLIRNGGDFRALQLSENARHAIYRGMLRLCPKLELKAFGVVIRKDRLRSTDAHEYAWTYLLQRLERLTTKQTDEILLVHDEGDSARIRTIARRARRAGIAGSAFGTGFLRVPFRRLIDDPVSRRSHESLFLQLADLVAYAAFRRVYPPPVRAVQVVPALMWDELGDARFAEVNRRSGGPSPGIVAWPK